jgi:hypothetical protein
VSTKIITRIIKIKIVPAGELETKNKTWIRVRDLSYLTWKASNLINGLHARRDESQRKLPQPGLSEWTPRA